MLTKLNKSSLFIQRSFISLCYEKLFLSYSLLTPSILPKSLLFHRDYLTNTPQSIVHGNSKITEFGRCGSIFEAEMTFNSMPFKNTITWTSLLTAYAQNGLLGHARKVFDEMPQRNIASWNAMITAYVRNGLRIREANELFNAMPDRNAVSYAAIITGFARAFMFEEAERLYSDMPGMWRDPVCSNALICGYLKAGRLDEASRVFKGMAEKDVVSWTSMVDGYCRSGCIEDAQRLFNLMPVKNVVSWTAMINGYMRDGKFEEGFVLFSSMTREDDIRVNPMTLTIVIEACVSYGRYREASQIHGLVLQMGFQNDLILCNSMIDMYGKVGCLDAAINLFDSMNKKDTISWNSMIGSYVSAHKIEEAYNLFQIMPQRDVISWTTMIGGFSGEGDMAKSIHLFNLMPQKDDVAWTTIISGLVQSQRPIKAIHWYINMTRGSYKPNVLTPSSVISAASALANIIIGSQLHAHVIKMLMEFELSIQNSLVTMYSKCGNISEAYRVFMKIALPNVISYNSMITGYAYHGLGQESLLLFKQMENEGIEPNEITFLGVLSACSHMGLVDQGHEFFKSMKESYHIEPSLDHYACMIDLLGRAGRLDQAVALTNSMPFEPHGAVWGALLSASQTHLRLDIARLAAKKLVSLEPNNTSPVVALEKIICALGKKEVKEVKHNKKLKWVVKFSGRSWVMVTENTSD